jgi:nucleoside-diphosphate-sugar epimerase
LWRDEEFAVPERLLVFGGFGFVGGVIAHSAALQGWDVVAAGGTFKPGLSNVAAISLDITDRAAVRRAVDLKISDAELRDTSKFTRETLDMLTNIHDALSGWDW